MTNPTTPTNAKPALVGAERAMALLSDAEPRPLAGEASLAAAANDVSQLEGVRLMGAAPRAPEETETLSRSDPAHPPSRRSRSLAKALTWRTTATVDTFIISYLVTGKAAWAGAIVSVEVVTKLAIYYLHERAWAHIKWGRK